MSMTTEQAIKHLFVLLKADADCFAQAVAKGNMRAAAGHKRDIEAHQIAVTALLEKAEREDPQPLTIEELRQMNGEPVWVENCRSWCLVNIEDYGIRQGRPFVHFIDRGITFTWDIEKRNLHCYRRKPKR